VFLRRSGVDAVKTRTQVWREICELAGGEAEGGW
jgi:hypothetical protein